CFFDYGRTCANVADSLPTFRAGCDGSSHQIEGQAVDDAQKIPQSAGGQRAALRRSHHSNSHQNFAECGAARRLHQPAIEKKYGADRKSTRLNSSHLVISYAVFCLKKKKKKKTIIKIEKNNKETTNHINTLNVR